MGEARARRRGGRHRGEGGGGGEGGGEGGVGHGHGGAWRSARLKNILKRVRAQTRKTRYGTKFASPESTSTYTLNVGLRGSRTKTVGLGVEPGFIGGSGYRYGAELASYSVYHRYRKYQN